MKNVSLHKIIYTSFHNYQSRQFKYCSTDKIDVQCIEYYLVFFFLKKKGNKLLTGCGCISKVSCWTKGGQDEIIACCVIPFIWHYVGQLCDPENSG